MKNMNLKYINHIHKIINLLPICVGRKTIIINHSLNFSGSVLNKNLCFFGLFKFALKINLKQPAVGETDPHKYTYALFLVIGCCCVPMERITMSNRDDIL